MILFTPNPDSIIKAYMLSKLTGDSVISEGSDSLLLFSGNAVINAGDYDISELSAQYGDVFLRDTRWLFTYKGNELRSMISTALRHSAEHKLGIILKSVEDCFSKGADYCLNGASAYGKKLRSLCSDVDHEVWRMVGFIRFRPAGSRCLVAKPLLSYDTADLILREFQKRYPNHKVVLLTDDRAVCMYFGSIYLEDKSKYESFFAEDSFDEIWEDYYKSQYIESRKNIKLASARIPKKYWNWLQEGSILKGEE